MKIIKKIIVSILTCLIIGLRPLFGPSGCCKFAPSCTQFAIIQLRDQSFFRAIWLILKRLITCSPFTYKTFE